MARPHANLKIDMDILKILFRMKSLHGVALAKLCNYEKKKIYIRLHAMKKRGTIGGIPYCEYTNYGSTENPNYKKHKKGTMYYLSASGVKMVKEELQIPVSLVEYSMKLDDDQLFGYYYSSTLVENLSIDFIAGKEYREQKGIASFVPIHLATETDQVLIFERKNTKEYRNRLSSQIKRLVDSAAGTKIIILCPSMNKSATSANQWNENFGPDALFLTRDNYGLIEKVLTEQTMPTITEALSVSKGEVQKLSQPVNGCLYQIGNEYCNVIDLIGYSPKALRKLTHGKTAHTKTYIGIESLEDLKVIARHFQDILVPNNEFVTLGGTCISSETAMLMFLKKGA